MIDAALAFAFGCFAIGLIINLWRIAVAPGVPDRVLALDTMVINIIALTVLYGIWAGTTMYFEVTLMFAMTGFIGTVAYAKFMLRGDIIE
jgi:multicomponent K+:H+ antiporter subunit F